MLNLEQEKSVEKDEFEKKAEDENIKTKPALELKISDIVPELPQITTSGSNDDTHQIESIDGGPYNNSTSQPNDSMKQSATSVQVEPTSFGGCIGKFSMQTNNI